MQGLRQRLVVGLTVFTAFALSGIAMATERDDTVLNFGYDEGSHLFLWNVTSLEYSPNDELLAEILEGFEESQLAALLAACGLEGDNPASPAEATFTFDPATGAITVTTADATEESGEIVCGDFSGGDVSGPAGQVNHGMFLKFFNANYEGDHRGCVVSQIASSGLGKGDQQVKTDDAMDADEKEPTEPTEGETEVVEGSITFTTVTTDCQHGNDDDADEELETDSTLETESKGNGPPQHVLDKFGGEHPGEAKGKPASTPGGP